MLSQADPVPAHVKLQSQSLLSALWLRESLTSARSKELLGCASKHCGKAEEGSLSSQLGHQWPLLPAPPPQSEGPFHIVPSSWNISPCSVPEKLLQLIHHLFQEAFSGSLAARQPFHELPWLSADLPSVLVPLSFIIGDSFTWLPTSPRGVTSFGCLSQVIKNRIHSFRASGIAVQGHAKALVQENTIFQGRTNKTIFQQSSNNQECIIQNNRFLVFKK